MEGYNPQKIEQKWQKIWEESGIYKTPDKVEGKKNFYHLVMFPYPSGNLHIGHWFNFAPADVYARFKRIQGFNIMSPIGFDAFGLPAENAAISQGIHPKDWTYKNIQKMREQLKSIGTCYDWSREVITADPKYYKWTQWMFLQLYKAGLAYRAKVPANFCPSCKTVLANEQVVDGKCERCESEVIQEEIEQWLFKITRYAEELLKDLEELDWPETTKIMQKNWIGRSESTEINFPIKDSNKKIKIVTTRTDTIFGATFLVLAPEHPLIKELKNQIKNYKELEDYIHKSIKKTDFERGILVKCKTGIKLEGVIAINPVNNKEIPIYISDFVLITYGTGAIMAVPAHDDRDFEFAKKFGLPIVNVIEKPKNPDFIAAYIYDDDNSTVAQTLRKMGEPLEYITPTVRTYHISVGDTVEVIAVLKKGRVGTDEDYKLIVQGRDFNLEMKTPSINFISVYMEDGQHINSGFLNGLYKEKAIEKMHEWLEKEGIGGPAVYYHLRDWLISRQRYWGAPIPMIFCQKCALRQGSGQGWQPVPEKDLPVLLPEIKDFRPTGEGKSPLAKSKKFVETSCPKCQGPAQRETDTMDTFVCSSWYYFRYTDPKNDKEFAAKEKIKTWLPVNMYIGGAEHTVMHLLYSRFFTKALRDLGYVGFGEPFLSLRHQGIILGPDGQKMSKSRGNVVDPDKQVKKYGSDVIRMYLCFMGPYNQGGPWNPKGIAGVDRFLKRVKNLLNNLKDSEEKNNKLEKILHKTIKKVTEDIENLRFNTAISALMILVNEMQKFKIYNSECIKSLLLMLGPFAPHITEELWQKNIVKNLEFSVQGSIHSQPWPRYDPKLIKEENLQLIIQINGKVRDKIEVEAGISEEKAKKLALSQEKIKQWIANKEIKKIIFVPGKLVNIVV